MTIADPLKGRNKESKHRKGKKVCSKAALKHQPSPNIDTLTRLTWTLQGHFISFMCVVKSHGWGFWQQLLHRWLLKASCNSKARLWHSCNVNSEPTVAPEGWAALLMWKIHTFVVLEILTGLKAQIPPPVNTKLISILWLCSTDKYVIDAVHHRCMFSFIYLFPASAEECSIKLSQYW